MYKWLEFQLNTQFQFLQYKFSPTFPGYFQNFIHMLAEMLHQNSALTLKNPNTCSLNRETKFLKYDKRYTNTVIELIFWRNLSRHNFNIDSKTNLAYRHSSILYNKYFSNGLSVWYNIIR